MVKQHVIGVDIIANVPYAIQQLNVQFAVLIACSVDGFQNIKFVLKRDGPVGNIKQRHLGLRVNWRHKGQGDVNGVGNVQRQRDVGRFIGHDNRFIVVVPSVVIDVATIVIVALWNRSVREVTFLIRDDEGGEFIAQVNVNELNGLVGHDVAVHVGERVLENSSRHGHLKAIRVFYTDFDRVG